LRQAICTISTDSHTFKARGLHASLKDRTDADFHCLLTDAPAKKDVSDIIWHANDSLAGDVAGRILDRYRGNALRWALKPIFILHLLNEYDRVIYVDNDICFYSSPDFLFDELGSQSILLTPHHYPSDPKKEPHWLEASLRVGLYNAGFIGASRSGVEAMQWWAECCAYNVRQSSWRGLFDDQRYLDLLPILFNDVLVLRHKGCNVAGWNIDQCPRSEDVDGSILLDRNWPLVFVHYNAFTIGEILKGKDPLLRPLASEYEALLQGFNEGFSLSGETNRRFSDLKLVARHLIWRMFRFFEA
jgi:hypothetical protein